MNYLLHSRLTFFFTCVLFVLIFHAARADANAAAPDRDSTTVGQGKVVETMNAGGYTYLLVDSGKEKTWVAIPESSVTTGETVRYIPGMTMENFHSKTLDRTFPSIIFSPGLEGQPSSTEKPATATESKNDESFTAAVQAEKTNTAETPSTDVSGGSVGAIVPFAEISVEKAKGENSYTVSEIFSNAKKLDGKIVRVRGKIMKISLAIMGRNWLHLQDGSGDPMANTHDLVITTTETSAEGKVVTVEGKLSADKDFGAGYSYAAIIEEAKILD